VSDAVLDGLLFDGRTAAATLVRVSVADGRLRVTTPDDELLHEVPLQHLVITEPFATAPRQVTLPGGAVVEVAGGAALTAALAAAGRGAGVVDWLQQRWLAAAASLVASVALLAGGYLYALPAAVRVISAALPQSAERRLGDGVFDVLDGRLFQQSTLTEAERSDVERLVAEAARLGAPGLEYQLVFRSTEQKPGVNAFALPGGTVVLLDELVRRTGGDERLLAVVAHELGHVARHHSTQSLLKAAGVGAVTSLLWGDFSGQAANLPAVLAMLDYSRDAEREADDDAVRFLHATGRSSRPMFDALCLLAAVEREAETMGLPSILSTHPDIEERLADVRQPGHTCADDGVVVAE
jgi:predicted Zn-dependent protease